MRDRELSVAFLDVVKPGIVGGMLLAEIKRMRPTQPLVVMTAYPDSESAAQAVAFGSVTLLERPFSIQHLRATVQGRIPER